MRRREFITLLGGAAAAWPLAARAQQGERVRRIGVLVGTAADDAIGQARIAAFLQALGQLDWMVGRNVRMDFHWAAADADHARGYAAEQLRGRLRGVWKNPHKNMLHDLNKTGVIWLCRKQGRSRAAAGSCRSVSCSHPAR
jgi:hypothetical protein